MQFKIVSINPEETLTPNEVNEKEFNFGSIAGSIGKEVNPQKKPGLNEDGAMICVSKSKILSIIIDGHYSRDTTVFLLEIFKSGIEEYKNKLDEGIYDDDFLKACNWFTSKTRDKLVASEAKGEASFMISLIDLERKRVLLYSVGDLMFFIHDPHRGWAPFYQLGQRHFFEWINISGITGYHFHSIPYHSKMAIIITTDGLIDEPVIKINEIETLFDVLHHKSGDTKAGRLVRYALQELTLDDNITCIYIGPTR